ncbi:MAG: undecaprenyldiphospho-muramoylpentapeptide beta-N-acetylglucosaminyltransferase [Parcubacteria group bacterium RIFCSPLOWO2_01_FULL_48_18]|nr:MAG: undecaprenyldiphospho-muramoylpentapeptide beta-N-acetylglucosaminyltransferase [Parcubacteria group bacterium RIFCSPLOWO2_01_FULL_48_18]OHB23542.1 MAG: undecaprenyldiphospho-muramoylpentapeptide beta-N-acetylglucosaminyltransferase [Parcubacteria group bacterium RIFCSPHIGHO2_02_FULL_48_10b]
MQEERNRNNELEGDEEGLIVLSQRPAEGETSIQATESQAAQKGERNDQPAIEQETPPGISSQRPQEVRIVLTGGGTGGHIVPLIAVARELTARSPNIEIHYVGSNGLTGKFFERENITLGIITSGKLRRYFSFKNFSDVFKLAAGTLQALWKLYWFMPDAVFSKGGHGAFPVLLAAAFYRIPIMIHESDCVPGLVNQWGARFASRIAISFDDTAKYFPKGKTVLMGNPIRGGLTESLEPQSTAKKLFGFHADEPVLFIMGGSQGAEQINDFILDILTDLLRNYQLIHQVGDANIDDIKSETDVILQDVSVDDRVRYKLFAFLSEGQYRDAMNAADIVISRAGSGSIFEIAAFAKPSILIPISASAGDHQRLNAIAYFKAGCCIYLEEENLLPHLFLDQLNELLVDRQRREKMIEASRIFARPRAAETAAREILTLAKADND